MIVVMSEADRERTFWELIRRALLMMARAIEQRYLPDAKERVGG